MKKLKDYIGSKTAIIPASIEESDAIIKMATDMGYNGYNIYSDNCHKSGYRMSEWGLCLADKKYLRHSNREYFIGEGYTLIPANEILEAEKEELTYSIY